jgi:hypothetical protein
MDGGYGEYDTDFDMPPMQGVPVMPIQGVSPLASLQARAMARPMPPQFAPPRGMPMPDPAQAYASQAAQHRVPVAGPPRILPPSFHGSSPDGLGVVQEPLPTGHLLGLSVLLPMAGTFVGMKYAGGFWGALGGALAAGSLINGYRAVKFMVQGDPEADREAVISGSYAVVGLGAAGWLLYKGFMSRKPGARKNEPDGYGDDSIHGVE